MLALLALIAAACSGAADSGRQAEPTTPPTLAPTASATPDGARSLALAAPTATPRPDASLSKAVVTVWWPEELYPEQDSEAETVLLSQFDGFRQAYDSYDLEVRRKRSGGLGGLLPTLRTAQPVAPGALPDIALMRRADMLSAATEGLIVPLGTWVPPELVGENLLPGARALGEINAVLYGVPYGVNLYFTAYRASVLPAPLLTFESVLDARPVYLFPGSASTVNQTLLLQYLSAGGRLADQTGLPVLDREPLETVYDYYAQGVAGGVFGPALLEFDDVRDYWDRFAAGEAALVAVDSDTYLAQRGGVRNIGLAPVPTHGGAPITALDGWLWVLTTQDPDRQMQARAFLNWMMRVNQQSIVTQALRIVPSQQRALRLWEDQDYVSFAQSLIQSAVVVPVAQRNSSAALALQEGFVAVLEGAAPLDAAELALVKVTP